MPDSFLILAPVLLLPIVALLRFVGCNQIFGLDPTILTEDHAAANCGGPRIVEGNVIYEKDDGAQGTSSDYFESEGGRPFKLTNAQVTDGSGNPVSALYATARIGASIKYTFIALQDGGYVVTLKFAEIAGAQNPGQRLFAIGINGSPDTTHPYDIFARAGGALIAHDESFPVNAPDGMIVIELAGLAATEALVNAIDVRKQDAITIAPTQITMFTGATQQFVAIPNFDAPQISWDLIHGSPSGQITSTGLYTAPTGILAPTQETVIAKASSASSPVEASAVVSIYLPIDTITTGAWVNKYGVDGYVLANTPPATRFPAYVAEFDVRLTDGTALNVASLGIPNNDPRVLTDPIGNPRPPLVWNDLNGTHGITLSFRFTDADPHLFGVYCLDNGPDRRQRFTITQLDSGITETVDSTVGTGTYLFWIGLGRIQIDVAKVPGSIGLNNVVNAVFFR